MEQKANHLRYVSMIERTVFVVNFSRLLQPFRKYKAHTTAIGG